MKLPRWLHLLIPLWSCSLAAQWDPRGPSSSLPQVVSVRIVKANQPPQSAGASYGSGIVIGREGSEILILTAMHVVAASDSTTRIVVGVGPKEEHVHGRVIRSSDRETDLAVIGIQYDSWARGERWTSRAPRMLVVDYRPEVGAHVFALGCPMGACWVPPVEGTIAILRPDQILIRIPYLIDGISGGPLVDDRGLILGMFSGYDDAGLYSVRPWNWILQWLHAQGIEADIPKRTVEQVGQMWSQVQTSLPMETAAWPDGSKERPFAIEFGIRASRSLDITAGYRRITLARPTLVEELPDGFIGGFTTLGLRYNRATMLDFGSARRPVMTFVGVNFLEGAQHRIMRLEAIPDSFELRTGEPVYHLVESTMDGKGWSATAGFRVNVYRGVTLNGSVTALRLNLPPEAAEFRNRILFEFGLGMFGRLFEVVSEEETEEDR